MVKIGVLADSHVKDRVRGLHPGVCDVFKSAMVSQIWHAGDVCTNEVIDELRAIAPVQVVQGNADVLMGCRFPMMVDETVENVRLAMTHGQGKFTKYLRDRISSLVFGPKQFSYFENQILNLLPKEADVLIFGHVHVAVNRWQNGQLLFNPGSCSLPVYKNRHPSVGILSIDGSQVSGEIVFLDEVHHTDLTPIIRVFSRLRKGSRKGPD